MRGPEAASSTPSASSQQSSNCANTISADEFSIGAQDFAAVWNAHSDSQQSWQWIPAYSNVDLCEVRGSYALIVSGHCREYLTQHYLPPVKAQPSPFPTDLRHLFWRRQAQDGLQQKQLRALHTKKDTVWLDFAGTMLWCSNAHSVSRA